MSSDYDRVSGGEFNALADELVNVMSRHCLGMEPREVVCIAAAAVADFGRFHFGDDSLDRLAKIVMRRREIPLPLVEVGQ